MSEKTVRSILQNSAISHTHSSIKVYKLLTRHRKIPFESAQVQASACTKGLNSSPSLLERVKRA